MKNPHLKNDPTVHRVSTLKIVGIYLSFGCIWILFSDQLLSMVVEDKDVVTRLQTLKGWAFQVVTAFMLYVLITRSRAESLKAIEALLKSEAKFRRVVECNMIGIIFWNANGQIIDANDAFLGIIGYTREQFQGKVSWREMTPPEYHEADERASEQRRAYGRSAYYEKEFIRKNGSRVPVLIGVATLAEGNETHVGFVMDIVARKRVEQTLRKSEQQVREILEKIQLVSVIFDRDGVLMFCNDFLLNLTSRQREEVIGTNWFGAFVPADQRELIKFTFSEMSKSGKAPPQIEYEIQTFHGERRLISWSNTVLRDANGNNVGITAIGEDVTERKQSEQQYRHSHERLRALSARLQRVREEERIRIAREIHDVLGQALTGLRMDVWWLVKRLSDSQHNLDRSVLLRKLDSMSKLINNTIPSVRKLATELRPGVLDDLGLVAAIEWQATEFQARTGTVCNCFMSVEDVDLDPDRSTAVFRIFQEILTNVARHAEATRVEIELNELADSLVLEVKDNGRGIVAQEISGTSSLGLLGMRERALLFGGEVRIGRGPVKGTVVTVTIPIQPKREANLVVDVYEAAEHHLS